MSKRYIDADKPSMWFEALAKHARKDGLYNHAHLYERCLQLIEEAPTADVVEVRHGEWITTDNRGLEKIVECSVCHSKDYYPFDYKNIRYPNYCGDCGAKMGGDCEDQTSQEVRWNKNLEFLKIGGFGSMDGKEFFETLLRYWKAQEQAGYPTASENVKYFESLIGDSKK